jgi:uncharacterized protein
VGQGAAKFDDEDRTLFCAIQHPGEDSGIPNSVNTWPEGDPIPRPSVVAVRHSHGGRIGDGEQKWSKAG